MEKDWIDDAISGLPPLATTDEVIGLLRMSRRNLYRLIASGRINARKAPDGGRLLIPRSELERYLRTLESAA